MLKLLRGKKRRPKSEHPWYNDRSRAICQMKEWYEYKEWSESREAFDKRVRKAS